MCSGPSEFFVSSLHGNGAISDGEFPVTVRPSSQGAVIRPQDPSNLIGKLHFPLPTLRSPEEETVSGKLTGHAISSVQLEILLSPHGQSATESTCCQVTRVELYAGRDQIGLWDRDGDLPTDQDTRIPVWSDIVGAEDNPFNDNPSGLCVTLTVAFSSGSSALLVSSVALIQSVRSRRKN